ncbi:MFS transporter, partial [Adlercreutzia sp. DFI.6.23]
MSVYFSLNVMVPLFLGEQVHWESTVAGFCMGPLVVAYALASLAGGRMLDRKGPRPLLPGGLGVAVAGSLLMMAAGLTASVPLVLAGALVVFV